TCLREAREAGYQGIELGRKFPRQASTLGPLLAAQNVLSNGGAGVSPLWLVGSILMLTLGELCLSPIGLATMTLLAPERMRGQMMGLWFCASALGNLAAGLIGGHVKA
ncbi:hypothetical protein JTM24_34995, partial [Pseudomonas aeruginosa]|nr:hypothetical protein [Pseudomonas aeruginosa]